MTAIPLPNPKLAETVRDLLRTLDDFEKTRPTAMFESRGPNGRITATADGRSQLTAITVDPSLIPTGADSQASVWLALGIATVANTALLQATSDTNRALGDVARNISLSFPLLPVPTPPQNWPDLHQSIALMGGKLIAAVPLAQQKVHTASTAGGQITAWAHGLGVITKLEIEPNFFVSVDRLRLSDFIVTAANRALADAYRALECDVAKFAGLAFATGHS